MRLGEYKDPYLSFRFRLEIDNLIKGGFNQVSGLEADINTEEYHEGGENSFVHNLPTLTKYPNLSLKKGIIDFSLWDWHMNIRKGIIIRKNIRITLINIKGEDGMSWFFKGAFPVRWIGPELNAENSTVAIETLEVVHLGIERV